MSELARLLGGFAAPYTVEHKGKTYSLRAVTHKVMTSLEKRSYKRARDSVHEMKEELDRETYTALLEAKSAAYSKGEYAFGTETSVKHYTSPHGIHELVAEIAGIPDDEARSLMEDKADEVTILTLCVLKDSFPNLMPLLIALEQQGNPMITKLVEQLKQMKSASA